MALLLRRTWASTTCGVGWRRHVRQDRTARLTSKVWHVQNAYCWVVSTLKRKLLRLLFPVLLMFAFVEAIAGKKGTTMKVCCGTIMERNVRMIYSKLHAALMLCNREAMTYGWEWVLQESLIQRTELNRLFGSSRDVIAERHCQEIDRAGLVVQRERSCGFWTIPHTDTSMSPLIH
jgi:hypothetical protein